MRSQEPHNVSLRVWDQLTIPSEATGLSEILSYISDSVQEPGIDGLARTNLRFSSRGGP
jgi:hypothetical protein